MKLEQEALLVIDMQNGFLEPDSPLCIAQAKATVPACARAIRRAREKPIPVIFVCRVYREDGSDVELPRRASWESGGKPLTRSGVGARSISMPEEFGGIQAGDYEVMKPRFSAFFQTELDLLLRRLGIRTIYLAGTTTPNCIRTTCYDGISLDYTVVILEDCCSSNTQEIQAANLKDMERVGAILLHSDDFLS